MEKTQLYHHCFEMPDIREGDIVPVGGGMIGSTDMPHKVRADFSQFSKFNEIAGKIETQYKEAAWQEWFKQAVPDVDPALVTALQSFTLAYESKRAKQKNDKFARMKLYDGAPDQTPALSEVFNADHGLCVEISVLAKKFLDDRGIKSRLFSGEAMFDYTAGDVNVPVQHTFLIIDHGGKEYIFDPTNPSKIQDVGMMFSLFTPAATFASKTEDMKRDNLMVGCENVLTKEVHYYGVGDCGNVPESHILHGTKSEQFKGPDTGAETARA